MKTEEFIEKWKEKISESMDFEMRKVILMDQFEEDAWSISKEEKPQTPIQRFLNHWSTRLIDISGERLEKFGKDTRELVIWAKEEGVKERQEYLRHIDKWKKKKAKSDETWVATPELRWARDDSKGEMFLQQKWEKKFIDFEDGIEWRKVPIDHI